MTAKGFYCGFSTEAFPTIWEHGRLSGLPMTSSEVSWVEAATASPSAGDALQLHEFSPADAVNYLQKVVVNHGPRVEDYLLVASAIFAIHQHEYIVTNGLSVRVRIFEPFEEFLQYHWRIFRTTASMQGFAHAKPHGYAGDFEMIERIYNRSVSTLDFLHRWDTFFHQTPATDAVRNRAPLVSGIINEENPGSLLSVGCGPGLDIRDAFAGNEYLQHVDFLDNDEKAIARAKINNAWAQGTSKKVNFFVKNALRFRPTNLYDIVWSSGLFDYLNDKTFLFLLRRLKEMISAKGKVVIGNFCDNNASRPYMECIGGWLLIHRTADDLLRLANEAGFSVDRAQIITDSTGINLFLIAERHP